MENYSRRVRKSANKKIWPYLVRNVKDRISRVEAYTIMYLNGKNGIGDEYRLVNWIRRKHERNTSINTSV